MKTYPQIEVPIRRFGKLEIKAGQEFDLTFRARVLSIEQEQIEVSTYGDEDVETTGGDVVVTLLLTDMRMPLHEVEAFAT